MQFASNLTCKITFYVSYRPSLALSRDRNFFWAVICAHTVYFKKILLLRIKNIPLYCSIVLHHSTVRKCDVIIWYCERLTDTLCFYLLFGINEQYIAGIIWTQQKPLRWCLLVYSLISRKFVIDERLGTGDIGQWLGCFMPFPFRNEKEEYLGGSLQFANCFSTTLLCQIFLEEIVKICITASTIKQKWVSRFVILREYNTLLNIWWLFLESWIINQHILTDVLLCRHHWLWLPVFFLQHLER